MLTRQRVKLSPAERRELKRRLRSESGRADDAKRARVILLAAAGKGDREIARIVGCSTNYVWRWKKRFGEERLAGLYSQRPGPERWVRDAATVARILAATRKAPSDGSTHWSTRKLAKHLKVGHMLVARVWRDAGLRPHRMERYMASDDPEFEQKALDVIGLYTKPPVNAVVFCVDEKTAVQALDRLDPVLPLSPGRMERHGFEYYRHGTLSLYAALNTKTGDVLAKTAVRHTSEEFVAFLRQIVAHQPPGQRIAVVLDNLSAHKTKLVRAFLEEHPNVTLHFTPTYSSWLNQVEMFFAKIERDVIARGVFASVKDLARKLMRYIRRYNRDAKPIKWTYTDIGRRIRPVSNLVGTGH